MKCDYTEEIEECKAKMAQILSDDEYMGLKETIQMLTEWREDSDERRIRYELSIIHW
tara:strand:+ start:4299 stop:4469 length:171 start_codon:yes stop_codon:yes gene_type:complete